MATIKEMEKMIFRSVELQHNFFIFIGNLNTDFLIQIFISSALQRFALGCEKGNDKPIGNLKGFSSGSNKY